MSISYAAAYRPARHPASVLRADNMVAIASGKGGVGKTWLAITLAQAFARRRARTLLFDGDLGLANVDIQLGLMPDNDLSGVVAGRLRLAEAAQSCAGGFDVIAGKSGSGSLAALDRTQFDDMRSDLARLAQRYDRVVLDLGAGVDHAVRSLAQTAGQLLVVTTDEPTALTDAYAFIKLTAAQGRISDLRIVVNMAQSARDGERTYAKLLKACEGFLRISPVLAGVIRRDERVRDAIRHQTPLLTRHPNSDAAVDVELLATRLAAPPGASP